MAVTCFLRIKRKGEQKRGKKQKRQKERTKQRKGESKRGRKRDGKRESEEKKKEEKFFTAGRAKKEIPKRAQPDATNFPAHVRGTVSPYPTVHSVICRLLYQKSGQWLVDSFNGKSMVSGRCPKTNVQKGKKEKGGRKIN